MLALGFFGFFALIGLCVGAAAGASIGGLVHSAMRRAGAGMAAAVIVATLVNALALWQIAALVQARYPGLRSAGPVQPPPRGHPDHASTKPGSPTTLPGSARMPQRGSS